MFFLNFILCEMFCTPVLSLSVVYRTVYLSNIVIEPLISDNQILLGITCVASNAFCRQLHNAQAQTADATAVGRCHRQPVQRGYCHKYGCR